MRTLVCLVLVNFMLLLGASMVLTQNYSCFTIPSNSSLVCSGRGICVSDNICQCESGRIGNQCQVITPIFDYVTTDRGGLIAFAIILVVIVFASVVYVAIGLIHSKVTQKKNSK